VIGDTLLAKAQGAEHGKIAERLGVGFDQAALLFECLPPMIRPLSRPSSSHTATIASRPVSLIAPRPWSRALLPSPGRSGPGGDVRAAPIA
jgi:hypothetical protein